MKSYKKPVLFILLVAGVVAAQSCKLLFKSDYAELKAADLTAFVEAAYPDMQKRTLAQNEQLRKKEIEQLKKAFAFAQAGEAEGMHKTDKFEKQVEFTIDRVLATKYTESNPDLVVSKEEWEAYYASHKAQFDAYINFFNSIRKQPLSDELKEQQREVWSQTKIRSDKGRQAGLEKDPGIKVIVKFVKANILANLYAKSVEEKNKLTDAEKKQYLAENPGADPDKLKEKAQGLLERVKKGEDFDKLATEFSDDRGSKPNGGDLGWFGKGIMDPAFEAAAFGLQKGQTTNDLVKSRFGYHIIRVEDRRMAPAAPETAPMIPGQAPGPEMKQEPREEVHARHILVDTTAFDQHESKTIQEKAKRVMEDAELKYPVVVPADFVINVAGLDRNRIPGMGGGSKGQMRGINPQENK